MLSNTAREPEAAFSTPFYTDNSDSHIPFLAIEGKDPVQMLESIHPQVGKNAGRAACWSFCSMTAVYTTKRLMVKHGYRKSSFPLRRGLLTSARLPYAQMIKCPSFQMAYMEQLLQLLSGLSPRFSLCTPFFFERNQSRS
ncbi:hypothetical protein ONS96_004138 [Cadophora gregata f. sp. sojae]|nr:hypothetical protein ONS96_004138 [Cadophora gregata f. sp. sojae]